MATNLKQNDRVVMQGCDEEEHFAGHVWTCSSDQFKSQAGIAVVDLTNFSGYFPVKYLRLASIAEIKAYEKQNTKEDSK